ncbi:MAG: hypothetical protein J5875_07320 [Paludibacteraceae bacterium]|jgi:hypothetical protein|nr:hypothetical protein [Paludibacteraceae bacterium]
MIKTVLNAVLVVAILVMGFLLCKSIQKPIAFGDAKDKRQAAVIKKLVDIRKAQECFKENYGHYTADFDSLKTFVKEGQKKVVEKKGTITDQQLEKGLTEKKAWEMVYKNNGSDAAKYGIEDFEAFKSYFRRDTVFQSVMEVEFGKDYPIDTLDIVPFTNGKDKFVMNAVMKFNEKSGFSIPLFEASVLNDVYLNGLDKQEIINMNAQAKNLEKFAGLKVGDVEIPNNNAGNWE